MFSWGEDYRSSFRLKKGSGVQSSGGVQLLDLSFQVQVLSVGLNVLGFVKPTGEAFIIRTNQSEEGRRTNGKQKFIKEEIRALSCGDDVVTMVTNRGEIFCVDSNISPFAPSCPVAFSHLTVTQVACGKQHSLAMTKDGQVYTWGLDSRGQLGLGERNSGAGSPQHLRSVSSIPVVRISAGGDQSFVLSVSGGVFGWGRNDRGQLGLGDTADRHTPAAVEHLNRKTAVRVSCGEEHTAVLTKGGAVFTFGSGRYGQLGHNSSQDELRPRLVAELWGAKVTEIACGRFHTLVRTDSMKVYSFGRNDQQQLGRGEDSPPSVPLPVPLQQLCATSGLVIENIFAGGDSSFATCVHKKDLCRRLKNDETPPSVENMVDTWISGCDSKLLKKIKKEIHETFSSASCMNRSFLSQSKDKHFQTSPDYPGLDFSLAQSVFKKLLKKEVLSTEVQAAVVQLLPALDGNPVGVEGLRVFLVLNELLHVIQKLKKQPNTRLAEEVAAAVQKLSPENLQIIGSWWASLPSAVMIRHVKAWRSALSVVLHIWPVPRRSIRNMLLVLRDMYNACKKKIPEKTFYVEMDQIILQEDLQLWRAASKTKDGNPPPLILCDFRFVLDLKLKKLIFDNNSLITQREHQTPQQMGFYLRWIPQAGPDYFCLNVKRASLLEDSFLQLAAAPLSDLRKPLVVHFDEDSKVTDVYKRDFFHHLFLRIVSDKPEMFMFNDSETLVWFSSEASEENVVNFYLFGVLCGLALYNNSIVHMSFPLVLFKKLLDVEPTLEDMIEFSEAVGGSLKYILDYEDDDLEDQDFTFKIHWDGMDVDLDPQDPQKAVTSQNKKQFIDAYVNYAFNTSVEKVFQEFQRGFFQVCDQRLLKLFHPHELQGMLVGEAVYDWEVLRQNTRYGWDCPLTHPTIQMFWEVFDELNEEKRKDFLWFLTGFRRAPVLGLKQIQMEIQVTQIQSGSPDQHFPESLTCHSTLLLPLYSTKEVMRDRLTEALKPERGFMRAEQDPDPGSSVILTQEQY
ncbi:putative E3 ubiquitin-protein ligase HERC3 [Nothobranchius furzeri]|nr:putative E3 ubiquitin-protein ligase HERC3 [Nothobranchius furzeri]